ncbi:MAG: hypothetical protein Q8934_13495 [Bacillota bacterium]|nr:hypothetical protein [Bacillota bacterium]
MQDISVISIVCTAVLALVCLFFILSPLFKWEAYLGIMAKEQDISQIKENLFSTLNEIEFEYKMDKISHNDYKNLKKQYEVQIAGILKDEEKFASSNVDNSLMDEVEREIEATMQSYKKKKGEGK